MLAVLMISTAILAYGFAQFRKTTINSTGIVLALITSCFIAAYTIVDGTGTRVAQNAMIYFGMTSICSGDKIAEIEVMDATAVSGPASDSVSDSGSGPAAGLAAGSAKSQQDLLG